MSLNKLPPIKERIEAEIKRTNNIISERTRLRDKEVVGSERYNKYQSSINRQKGKIKDLQNDLKRISLGRKPKSVSKSRETSREFKASKQKLKSVSKQNKRVTESITEKNKRKGIELVYSESKISINRSKPKEQQLGPTKEALRNAQVDGLRPVRNINLKVVYAKTLNKPNYEANLANIENKKKEKWLKTLSKKEQIAYGANEYISSAGRGVKKTAQYVGTGQAFKDYTTTLKAVKQTKSLDPYFSIVSKNMQDKDVKTSTSLGITAGTSLVGGYAAGLAFKGGSAALSTFTPKVYSGATRLMSTKLATKGLPVLFGGLSAKKVATKTADTYYNTGSLSQASYTATENIILEPLAMTGATVGFSMVKPYKTPYVRIQESPLYTKKGISVQRSTNRNVIESKGGEFNIKQNIPESKAYGYTETIYYQGKKGEIKTTIKAFDEGTLIKTQAKGKDVYELIKTPAMKEYKLFSSKGGKIKNIETIKPNQGIESESLNFIAKDQLQINPQIESRGSFVRQKASTTQLYKIDQLFLGKPIKGTLYSESLVRSQTIAQPTKTISFEVARVGNKIYNIPTGIQIQATKLNVQQKPNSDIDIGVYGGKQGMFAFTDKKGANLLLSSQYPSIWQSSRIQSQNEFITTRQQGNTIFLTEKGKPYTQTESANRMFSNIQIIEPLKQPRVNLFPQGKKAQFSISKTQQPTINIQAIKQSRVNLFPQGKKAQITLSKTQQPTINIQAIKQPKLTPQSIISIKTGITPKIKQSSLYGIKLSLNTNQKQNIANQVLFDSKITPKTTLDPIVSTAASTRQNIIQQQSPIITIKSLNSLIVKPNKQLIPINPVNTPIGVFVPNINIKPPSPRPSSLPALPLGGSFGYGYSRRKRRSKKGTPKSLASFFFTDGKTYKSKATSNVLSGLGIRL